MISINDFQLVQNFLQQNKANEVNLSLLPGAMVVNVQTLKRRNRAILIKSCNVHSSLVNNCKTVE